MHQGVIKTMKALYEVFSAIKLYKSVLGFYGSTQFEMARKNPSTAPSGMMIEQKTWTKFYTEAF